MDAIGHVRAAAQGVRTVAPPKQAKVQKPEHQDAPKESEKPKREVKGSLDVEA